MEGAEEGSNPWAVPEDSPFAELMSQQKILRKMQDEIRKLAKERDITYESNSHRNAFVVSPFEGDFDVLRTQIVSMVDTVNATLKEQNKKYLFVIIDRGGKLTIQTSE